MLPPTTLHRGRFPRTLIDYHSGVVSVGLHVSSKILDLLSQLIAVIRERVPALRSSTYLDIIEGIVGARGIQYLSEAAVTGVVAFQLAALCVRHRGVPYKDFEALRNSRLYVESIESNMPHVVRWYRVIYGLNIGGRLMECAEVFRNSPSILGRTPAAATRQHSEEIARGLWRQPPAAGKVRLHFFQTHHTGRYDPTQGNLFQHPDVRIDLDFDPNHGIKLGKAREFLGVENLSIITCLSPHRTTFDPIDQNKLSPIAVYDLSKQLREPIRVFEPCPSRITKVKRKIHDIAFLTIYLVSTLVRSCLGFTLHDRMYIAVTFGDNFEATCTRLSRSIHPLNLWTREGAWLIAQLSASLFILPLVILFKAAMFMQSCLSCAGSSTLAMLFFFLAIIRDVISSRSRLPLTTLIAVIALSWITLADLLL